MNTRGIILLYNQINHYTWKLQKFKDTSQDVFLTASQFAPMDIFTYHSFTMLNAVDRKLKL